MINEFPRNRVDGLVVSWIPPMVALNRQAQAISACENNMGKRRRHHRNPSERERQNDSRGIHSHSSDGGHSLIQAHRMIN